MKTAIVGVGNCLMKDEGIGVHVARALGCVPLPADVVVIDAGTDPEVAFDLDEFDRIIVVDAACGGEEPGTIYRLTEREALDTRWERQACHDIGFLETLRRIVSKFPDVLVVGIEPKEIGWGLELSPVLHRAVPRVVRIVQQELRRWRCS